MKTLKNYIKELGQIQSIHWKNHRFEYHIADNFFITCSIMEYKGKEVIHVDTDYQEADGSWWIRFNPQIKWTRDRKRQVFRKELLLPANQTNRLFLVAMAIRLYNKEVSK